MGSSMNILVMGGTRFVGKSLVERLQAEGHALTLFTRGLVTHCHQWGLRMLRTTSEDFGVLSWQSYRF